MISLCSLGKQQIQASLVFPQEYLQQRICLMVVRMISFLKVYIFVKLSHNNSYCHFIRCFQHAILSNFPPQSINQQSKKQLKPLSLFVRLLVEFLSYEASADNQQFFILVSQLIMFIFKFYHLKIGFTSASFAKIISGLIYSAAQGIRDLRNSQQSNRQMLHLRLFFVSTIKIKIWDDLLNKFYYLLLFFDPNNQTTLKFYPFFILFSYYQYYYFKVFFRPFQNYFKFLYFCHGSPFQLIWGSECFKSSKCITLYSNSNYHRNKNLLKLLMLPDKLLILLLVIAPSIFCINMFNQMQLTTKNGAMCMDGSPYAIYTYIPDPLDVDVIANKLLIFWQEIDFGWCFKGDTTTSLDECHKYLIEDSLIDAASSINWPYSQFFLTGILSLYESGYFVNWPKVLIKSCDGGSYLGNSAPISYKGKKLHFRGSQNVKQAVNYLNKINFLKNREEVVMVGSFNAGIGMLAWSDYFRAQTNGKFKLIADATLYLNAYSHKHNSYFIEARMKQVEKFALQNTTFPNSACALANPGAVWKCLFVEQLIKHIIYPVYFMQSLYDGWDVTEVLGFACVEQFGSLSECKQQDRQIIEDYHKNVTAVLHRIIDSNQQHSAFAIACVAHQFLGGKWDNEWYQVPEGSGHRPITATSKWARSQSRELYIDAVQWPHNKICARKTSPAPAEKKRRRKQSLLRSQ